MQIISLFSRLKQQRDGAMALTVALAAIVLVGFSALGIEIAASQMTQSRMQQAADAAALAAVKEISLDPTSTQQAAIAQAQNYLNANYPLAGVNVVDVQYTPTAQPPRMQVDLTIERDYSLGRIFGQQSGRVSVTATASLGEAQPLDVAVALNASDIASATNVAADAQQISRTLIQTARDNNIEDLYLSFVPYNTLVNQGGALPPSVLTGTAPNGGGTPPTPLNDTTCVYQRTGNPLQFADATTAYPRYFEPRQFFSTPNEVPGCANWTAQQGGSVYGGSPLVGAYASCPNNNSRLVRDEANYNVSGASSPCISSFPQYACNNTAQAMTALQPQLAAKGVSLPFPAQYGVFTDMSGNTGKIYERSCATTCSCPNTIGTTAPNILAGLAAYEARAQNNPSACVRYDWVDNTSNPGAPRGTGRGTGQIGPIGVPLNNGRLSFPCTSNLTLTCGYTILPAGRIDYNYCPGPFLMQARVSRQQNTNDPERFTATLASTLSPNNIKSFTDSHLGLLWAMQALAPAWQPIWGVNATQKGPTRRIIILTDVGNSRNDTLVVPGPGPGVDPSDLTSATPRPRLTTVEMNDRLDQLCTALRNESVIVVVYELDTSVRPDDRTRLQRCVSAGAPSRATWYYQNGELGAMLNDIGTLMQTSATPRLIR